MIEFRNGSLPFGNHAEPLTGEVPLNKQIIANIAPNQIDHLKIKPWLGSSGHKLTEVDLRVISTSWDADTWERFLQATVDKEQSRQETLLDGYEELLENEAESVSYRCALPSQLQHRIHQAICQLSKVQRGIIRGVYFYDLSQSEIGRRLKISRQTVNQSKTISLNRIRDFLEKHPDTAAYLIGGCANLNAQKRSRDEEIIEVYLKELGGSYLK